MAAGLAMAAALLFPGLWFLVFAGPALLMAAVDGLPPARALGLALAAGWLESIVILYWLFRVLTFFGGLSPLLATPVFLALTGYNALYTGLFGLGLALGRPLLKNSAAGWLFIPLAAALYTAGEAAKGWLFTGFPFSPLGSALYPHLALVQGAELFGSLGLTFFIVLVAALVYAALAAARQGQRRRVLACLGLAAAFLLGAEGFGLARLASLERKMAEADTYPVAVVQANIAQEKKWDPYHRAAILNTYRDLSLAAAASQPWLIVWPEAATPFYYGHSGAESVWLEYLVRRLDTPLLFGSLALEPGPDQRLDLFNRVWLVGRQGQVMGRYDKTRLVPYGEFVPFKEFMPFIGLVTQASGDTTPGRPGELISLEGVRLGVLICYESLFARLGLQRVRQGTDILVNPTNDAWFGPHFAPRQLLAQAALRCVETRRPMIRAAVTGISALITPTGRVSAMLGPSRAGLVQGRVGVRDIRTFYTRAPFILPLACWGLIIVIFLKAIYLKIHAWRKYDAY